MNTVVSLPSNAFYRPQSAPAPRPALIQQGSVQGMTIRPHVLVNGFGNGGASQAARPAVASAPNGTVSTAASGAAATTSSGSFLDDLVKQVAQGVEKVIEKAIVQLVEKVVGAVVQKLTGDLGLTADSSTAQVAADGSDAVSTEVPGTAALNTAALNTAALNTTALPTSTAPTPGAVTVDLPPIQFNLSQANTQTSSPSQTTTQPAQTDSGGIFSSITSLLSGFGDKLSSVWDVAKNLGSSLFREGSVLSKVTSFFGF